MTPSERDPSGSSTRPEDETRPRPPSVHRLNAFGYLLTLGFRPGSLLPRSLVPLARRIDDLTRPIAALTAMRALIVWDRL